MIQSIERAKNILCCFDEKKEIGITQIAQMMDLNKSTAFGIVSTLEELGLLEKNAETGKYRLGMELFRLGNMVEHSDRQIAADSIAELSEKLGETANFLRPKKGDVIYLAKCESKQSMRICTTIGMTIPMYCTAAGKAILAFYPENEKNAIIDTYRFEKFTENTIKGKRELLKELDAVRKKGYATETEEYEKGLVCVGVPILNRDGHPIAAVSCSGPIVRMNSAKIKECTIYLKKCAEDLSHKIM